MTEALRASDPELLFKIVVGDMALNGSPVRFSELCIGDVKDLEKLEERLSRLLGVRVRIETGDE